jgi:hypothetical protein
MKTSFAFILIAASLAATQANAAGYLCKEGTVISGHLAQFVKDGTILNLDSATLPATSVNVSSPNLDKAFGAEVHLPPIHTLGSVGSIVSSENDFSLSFAVVPPYRESSSDETVIVGTLTYKTKSMLVFCEDGVLDLFHGKSEN